MGKNRNFASRLSHISPTPALRWDSLTSTCSALSTALSAPIPPPARGPCTGMCFLWGASGEQGDGLLLLAVCPAVGLQLAIGVRWGVMPILPPLGECRQFGAACCLSFPTYEVRSLSAASMEGCCQGSAQSSPPSPVVICEANWFFCPIK